MADRTTRRFLWLTDYSLYDRDGYNQICVDLLTNEIVVRYDLGDPANYDPNYGGRSEDEYLKRKGFDPNERITFDQAIEAKVAAWSSPRSCGRG